jgi:hypothetical protein
MNRAFSRGLLASTLIVALAAIADGGGNGVMRLVNTCSSCYGVECGLAPPDWSPERQLLVDRLRRQLPDPCYVTDCSSVAKRDLNKDGHAEYFVPVSCGATGNCTWLVVGDSPARLLGTVVGAQYVYVSRRGQGWGRLTAYTRVGGDECVITTYAAKHGKYVQTSERTLRFSGYEGSPFLARYGVPNCR